MITKTCTKCGETKPLDGFNKDRRRKDSRRSQCKSCEAEYKRQHKAENRDKIAERERRYYEKNRDEIAERERRYYEKNRDEIAERRRRYREENRDKLAEKQRRHYEKNRDGIRERQRSYYEANRDEIAEKGRRYRAENRDIVNAKTSKHARATQELTEMFATAPPGTPWTSEEEYFLMAEDGMTIYQKATALGRTYSACKGKLAHLRKKLGVSPGDH